jgi:hypothetical protein
LRFYWRGGEKYIREQTKWCVMCAHKNNSFSKKGCSPLIPIPVTPKVFWRVHADLCGPFPISKKKNKYIAIAICAFTKYVEGKGNNS